jgi:sugar-phosphatase
MNDFKAIIYDLDGTLIDSERHWEEAGKHFFAKRGLEQTPELRRYMMGRNLTESLAYLKKMYGWQEEVEEARAEFLQMTEEIYRTKAIALDGASNIINYTRSVFKKQAIASGSALKRIELIVDRLQWRQAFDCLVSSEHVNYVGKPNPAIFFYAANQLGVNPSDCMVIEDSENGIIAAKAAGMSCVAVPERNAVGDFSRADLVVESLEDERLKVFFKNLTQKNMM